MICLKVKSTFKIPVTMIKVDLFSHICEYVILLAKSQIYWTVCIYFCF